MRAHLRKFVAAFTPDLLRPRTNYLSLCLQRPSPEPCKYRINVVLLVDRETSSAALRGGEHLIGLF